MTHAAAYQVIVNVRVSMLLHGLVTRTPVLYCTFITSIEQQPADTHISYACTSQSPITQACQDIHTRLRSVSSFPHAHIASRRGLQIHNPVVFCIQGNRSLLLCCVTNRHRSESFARQCTAARQPIALRQHRLRCRQSSHQMQPVSQSCFDDCHALHNDRL